MRGASYILTGIASTFSRLIVLPLKITVVYLCVATLPLVKTNLLFKPNDRPVRRTPQLSRHRSALTKVSHFVLADRGRTGTHFIHEAD